MTPPEKIDRLAPADLVALLLDACQWQDGLLQAYRSFHLTTQSIFLAIGAGLTVAVVSLSGNTESLVSFGLLVLIGTLAIWIGWRLKHVVLARGRDVNWWHRRLIEAEKDLAPMDRLLTQFKMYQPPGRAGAECPAEIIPPIAEVEATRAEELVGSGLGHTRRVVDLLLFRGIQTAWAIMVLASLVHVWLMW